MPRALSETALPIRFGGAGSPITSPSIVLASLATTWMPSPGTSPTPATNTGSMSGLGFLMTSVSDPATPVITFWLMTDSDRKLTSFVCTKIPSPW